MRKQISGLGSAVSLLALACAAPAFAQSADAAAELAQPQEAQDDGQGERAGGGEIVITATRRAESLSRVPISVSAYSQDQLDRQSVRDFKDVARLTPGVTFTPGTRGNGGASNVSIRGISSGSGSATVGVYIDETPVQVRPSGNYSSSNPYPRIFDLERVEILRGPQGTLFGAGSEGGTIRFITPEPSLSSYSVYGRTEVATTQDGDGSYEAGVAAGGPIVTDSLGLRVSGWYRRDGGVVDKVDWYDGRDVASNVDWSETYVLRAALKWQPSSALTITPSIFYQNYHSNDTSVYWEKWSKPKDTKFVTANRIRTPTDDSFWLASLKAELDLGFADFVSNTALLRRTKDSVYDSTTLDVSSFTSIFGTPVDTIPPPAALRNVYSPGYVTSRQRTFTQEARLQSNNPDSRLKWVLGVYYQRAKERSSYDVESTFINDILSYAIGAPVTIGQIFGSELYQGRYLFASSGTSVDEEIAGFGQFDLKLTDNLTVTAGVRVSHVKYESEGFSAGPVSGGPPRTTTSEASADPVTPKVGISWQATSETMLYASAAKGFRAGATTGAASSQCAADLAALGLGLEPRTIQPDSVWSYELGGKTRLFGGRLSIDGSVYRIDWKNIQSGGTLPNCNTPFAANFGDARSQGFDLTINARVTDNLTLGASVGYADAEFTTNTAGANNIVIRSKGEPLPIAPWQVVLSAQYDFAALGRDAYLRADYQYLSHDKTPLDRVPTTDFTIPRAPASNNLDLRLGMKLGPVDLSVFAQNLTNQHPQYGRYRDSASTFNYRGVTVRPRTFGVTGVFRY